MQYVHGTLKWSIIPGPERRVKGESPRVEVRNALMISPTLTKMIRQNPNEKNPFYPCQVSRSAAA